MLIRDGLAKLVLPRDSFRMGWARRLVRHGGWAVATDGRAVLAVHGAADLAEADVPTEAGLYLGKMLSAVPCGGWTGTTLPDLWAFLGPYHRTPCPYCRQYRDAGIACGECEGQGFHDGAEEPRRVDVAGAVVDADLVLRYVPAWLADHFGEGCRFGRWDALPILGGGTQRAVLVEGPRGEWRAVVSPMAADPDPARPVYLPGAGEAAGLPGPVRADWYDERGESDHAAALRRPEPAATA